MEDFFAASYWRNTKAKDVRADIAWDLDVHSRDVRERTPLMMAVMYGDKRSVEAVIDGGADVNATDFDGLTPFLYAAKHLEDVRVLDVLEEAGADPLATDNKGTNALMRAALDNQDEDVTNLLLKYDIDIDAQDRLGHTALLIACRWNRNPKVALTLLDAGAAWDIRDKKGETALDYIYSNPKLRKHKKVARLLSA